MQTSVFIVFIILVILSVRFIITSTKKKKVKAPSVNITDEILQEHVAFYQRLDIKERERFRKTVAKFFEDVVITPVQTEVSELDRIMVAASAVIPMFAFENWTYPNLDEVLVYNDNFNAEFQTEGNVYRNIMGQVGTGVYKNKMMLSKAALQTGFNNGTDKSNTAIHEFVHLIDAADGETDGVPRLLLDKMYTVPWLELMHREMEKINEGNSDINPYGSTNKTEFFAVAAEYFFERPDLLEEKHPELFKMLQKIFNPKKATF